MTDQVAAEPAEVTPVAPKKRGRPRIHPLPDPNAPKRKPGRPKKSPEEEKAELEALRSKCLEMRSNRTQKIRQFDPNNNASNDAETVFGLACHLIRMHKESRDYLLGQDFIDLIRNMTSFDLELDSDRMDRLMQAIHRIAKYDTKEVKDEQDTFAYGVAPDGKSPLAKELNKPFASMRIFWAPELETYYLANTIPGDELSEACRYMIR